MIRPDAPADAWAATVVAAVGTTYPWASQHVVTGPDDVDASLGLRT